MVDQRGKRGQNGFKASKAFIPFSNIYIKTWEKM